MGSDILFIINISEPSFFTRGLIAIVKAATIEDARAKIAHLDNTVPAKLINTIEWETLGNVEDFQYSIYEYWE